MKHLSPRVRPLACVATLVLAVGVSGCTSLTPQLHPTDIAELEQIEDRQEREQAYIDNAIVRKKDLRGIRYTKGERIGARPRSWQSLDLILRSDRNSSAALPEKKIRAARVLTGFLIASSIVVVGGIGSSAREGLDLEQLSGTSAALLGGGLGMLAFGISAGVVWGQAKSGYEDAVNIYNDSLALRLGISDANGQYRPPEGVLIDEEGFIILDQKELSLPQLRPKPPPTVERSPAPAVERSPSADGEPESGESPEGEPGAEGEPASSPDVAPGKVPDAAPDQPPELASMAGEDAPPPAVVTRSLVGPARTSP